MGSVKVFRETRAEDTQSFLEEQSRAIFPQCVLLLYLVGSRIPAQYAEACLLKQAVGHTVVDKVLTLGIKLSSVVGTTENWLGTS